MDGIKILTQCSEKQWTKFQFKWKAVELKVIKPPLWIKNLMFNVK